jgi:hypothetical protein
MTKDEAISALSELDPGFYDYYGHVDAGGAHMKADEILIKFLSTNGFDGISNAWTKAKDNCGFWCA